jgi:hypothetical protein
MFRVQVTARRPAILTEVIRGFPQSPIQIPGYYLNEAMAASFHVLSDSLFINDPIIRRCIVRAAEIINTYENIKYK